MGFTSIWHWLIVLAIVLVLFGGRGKISALMGDFGKGLNAFKKNVKDTTPGDDADDAEPAKKIAAEEAANSAEKKG